METKLMQIKWAKTMLNEKLTGIKRISGVTTNKVVEHVNLHNDWATHNLHVPAKLGIL